MEHHTQVATNNSNKATYTKSDNSMEVWPSISEYIRMLHRVHVDKIPWFDKNYTSSEVKVAKMLYS